MRLLTALFLLLSVISVPGTIPALAAGNDAATGGMTNDERAYLLSELKSTESAFLSSIQGLTPAQWTYKPSPEIWSIQECAEHVILAEDLIFEEARKTLQTPQVPRLANATSEGDREVVAKLQDRSNKAKSPKVLQPVQAFSTPESAIREFNIRREKTIAYVTTTHDALRIHAGEGPAGFTSDVYQFLLQLAAHSGRHTAQILEVKSSTGYPSS